MLILKIAFRNIFRNTRRSVTTLSTIAIGAGAVLVFGAYVTYIEYGVQTNAVQRTGHFQVFRNGYFNFGTAAPGAWGIDNYENLFKLIKEDAFLKPVSAVITPIQSLSGIVGNFDSNTSKTFFGVGFVPSERDRMKQWNEYGTGSQGLRHSGLKDDDLSEGITGIGLVRILGLCDRLHLDDCPKAPHLADGTEGAAESAPSVDLAELSKRDKSAWAQSDSEPTIDLLAATAGGAPNVVSLQIKHVELQPLKELDDNYIGMNIGLAQNLIYGRSEHKATGIIVQLNRTEDMKSARARLLSLFKEHDLDLELRDFTELNPQYNQIIALFESIFSFISVIICIVVLFTVCQCQGDGHLREFEARSVRRGEREMPACFRLYGAENIGRAAPFVFVIPSGFPPGFGRRGKTNIGVQSDRLLVQADHRLLRIVGLFVRL